ncbi:MAG: preprotein translocase subunit SecA, partial [bacterium]|nr:preprotein translocase subunit SecA [bacterium]
MSLLSKLFGGSPKVDKRYYEIVEQVNALEGEVQKFSADELKAEAIKLKTAISNSTDSGQTVSESLETVLPRAFALTREAAKRTLKQRHFDVQIIGGAVLHSGAIAEMRTGEGKTLVATLPTALNALAGKGSHVVTVNEYLAKRDTVWMGQVYNALGLSVACLTHGGALIYDPAYRPLKKEEENPLKEGGLIDKERDTTGAFIVQEEYLRPISRKEAYACDITYGTNHEFGFDYLRDNLARSKDQQSQRQHFFAVIDEVDSILIDEARTPLIIAAPDAKSSDFYKQFARIVSRLEKEVDYLVDEKQRAVQITDSGINKVEQMSGIKNLYEGENLRLTHYLQECLRAYGLFTKDKDYVIKNNEVIIVDQFTGRLMQGRRYSGGLHQAIEAKEGVLVQEESRTYAQISIQNYFRLYPKLSGMTGTAQTSAEEFHKVYSLEVVTIPTNRTMIRQDLPDLIYKTIDAKYKAIIEDIKNRTAKGQPVLIGTVSIEKNEELARRLHAAGIKHEVLNAKNNEREGSIIAQAGRKSGVMVATNMAGRGVDIILGGNPPEIKAQQEVRDVGGLHVIGTERHESRRID